MSLKLFTRTRTVLMATSFAALAVPAMASAACPTASASTVFAPWGDSASYSQLAGGTFETGTTPWTLSNAAVVTGNEPWKVAGSINSKALVIKNGGSATSPWFCVGYENPTFRFFARRASGSWGGVYYDVRWYDSANVLHTTNVGYADGSDFASWSPSDVLPLGTLLPLWQTGQTLKAQLVFRTMAGGSDMAIDDVYIDPYMRS